MIRQTLVRSFIESNPETLNIVLKKMFRCLCNYYIYQDPASKKKKKNCKYATVYTRIYNYIYVYNYTLYRIL